jgi:sec-independent protein translocase protein TatA
VTANIFGTDSLYVLIIAIVVLFGGSQLPKLARNAGEAMKEFRKAHNDAVGNEASSAAPPVQTQVAAPPAVLPPTPAPQAAPPAANPDERVTLSRAELDALLADREARAKAASGPDGQK